jgi:hypothetical protein
MKLPPLLHRFPAPTRARLFRDLVALVLITVGVLATASALLLNNLNRDLAEARIGAATALVREEVRSLLTPVQQQLLIVQDALRDSHLTPADMRALNARIIPVLTHIDQISGAVFADDRGGAYYLRHDDKHWLTRTRSPGNVDTAELTLTRWLNADQELDSTSTGSDQDARQRPWFRLAASRLEQQPAANAKDALVWSPPYRFHTLNVPGTTASIAWRDEQGLLVVAFDVTLERIMRAIDRLDLGSGGRGFLFSADGGVYSGQADQTQASGFLMPSVSRAERWRSRRLPPGAPLANRRIPAAPGWSVSRAADNAGGADSCRSMIRATALGSASRCQPREA